MKARLFQVGLCLSSLLFVSISESFAQTDLEERQTLVAMRMIGHEVLLHSGDSLSRILPIEKQADRYKIQFESDFHFYPGHLAAIIDGVIKKTGIAERYLVEALPVPTVHWSVTSF